MADHGSRRNNALAASGTGIAQVLRPALAPLKIIRRDLGSPAARELLNVGDTSGVALKPLPTHWRDIERVRDGLPALGDLKQAHGALVRAVDARATETQIAQIVGAILSMKNGDGAKRAPIVEGLVFALSFEADCSTISPFVLAAASYEAVRASPFVPDLSEILDRIPKTTAMFAGAPHQCNLLIDARTELDLEWRLLQQHPAPDMPDYVAEEVGADACPI